MSIEDDERALKQREAEGLPTRKLEAKIANEKEREGDFSRDIFCEQSEIREKIDVREKANSPVRRLKYVLNFLQKHSFK
jgi:hypothetical protein